MCPVRVFFYFSYTGILLFPFRGYFCLYVLVLWQIHVCTWYILSPTPSVFPFSVPFISFWLFVSYCYLVCVIRAISMITGLGLSIGSFFTSQWVCIWFPFPLNLSIGCYSSNIYANIASVNRFCLTDDIIVCRTHSWLRTLTFFSLISLYNISWFLYVIPPRCVVASVLVISHHLYLVGNQESLLGNMFFFWASLTNT